MVWISFLLLCGQVDRATPKGSLAITEVSSKMSLSHFASVSFGRALYIHGGSVGHGHRLSNDLLRLDASNLANPVAVQTEGQMPAPRSHHRGDVIQERFWVLVGGWDGRRRLSDVLVLDLAALKWLEMSAKEDSTQPAGLSGHAVCALDAETLVVSGREGGIREQRRFAGLFLLHVDPRSGKYAFREVDKVSQSRSGHSLHLIHHNQLLLLGGRADGLSEILSLNENGQRGRRLSNNSSSNGSSSSFQTSLRISLLSGAKRVERLPNGMRYHASLDLGEGHVLLHGGQDLGKSSSAEETTHRTMIVIKRNNHNNEDEVDWYEIDTLEESRAGHALWIVDSNKVLIVGGIRGRQRRRGSLKSSRKSEQPLGPLDVVPLINS